MTGSIWHALRLLVVLVALAIAAASYVYLSNARMFDHRYPVVRTGTTSAVSGDAVLRGRQLADRTGCTDCHRPDLRGGVFIDEGWAYGRYYASNLTLKAKVYSDEDLARIIRLGVRPDGRGVVAMPSFGFVRLTDAETADIVAFIRSLPAAGAEQPSHHIGPIDQWRFWRGVLKPAAAYVAEERGKNPVDAGDEHEAARHLVGIVCAECHGGDLTGDGWGTGAPDLAIVRSYALPQFTQLLRAGTAVGERKIGLMARVARDRLHHLSDAEIDAIYAYLTERAKRASR